MTTDRIHTARAAAAPTDRPAQQGEGSGFAVLLEAHAAPASAPRRDEAPRADTARPEASRDASHEASNPDASRAYEAPNPDTSRAGAEGDNGSPTSPGLTPQTADAPAATAPTELPTGADPHRQTPPGLPVVPAAPAGVAHDVAPGHAAIIVPPAPVNPAAQVPVAPQPLAPGAVPASPTFEAAIVAPALPAAVTPAAAALDAGVPAPATPALQTPTPVASPNPVAALVEGAAPVGVAVAAAPSPEPAPAAAPAPAPAAEPAPAAAAEPQPAAPVATGPQPAASAPAAATAAPERAVPLHRAPAAVATLLHVAAERGITHARMTLRPAELGGIEIRLQATAAGIAAQVVADSPEAARLLTQAGDDLRRALEAREVTLLSLEVSTSSEERSRESARGERSDAGQSTDRAPAGDEPTTSPTQTVIELPGGLLVDVLA